MVLFDATFIAIVATVLSTVSVCFNAIVVVVIVAEKELRINSCYRIIFILCLSGLLNGIAFVPNSAIFLLDVVGLPSAEH
ncbi:hypothetical protein AAVH_33237, partial [Aphelenchoides avenae]